MAPDSDTHWHPQIGLALGGGVARGFAHIGVLRTLEKYGIVPDIVVGTSIGAVVEPVPHSVLSRFPRALRRAD